MSGGVKEQVLGEPQEGVQKHAEVSEKDQS